MDFSLAPDGVVWEYSNFLGQNVIKIYVNDIPTVLEFLRERQEYRFRVLVDICGVDYLDRDPRFEIVYHLLSLRHNCRVRVKAEVPDEFCVPGISEIFPAADWFEREVFDMYGITFSNHPDLRRILTEYDFSGFPLRKDFPLSGYTEVRYDEERKCVVHEPVVLTQAYRKFDFESPWEGILDTESNHD